MPAALIARLGSQSDVRLAPRAGFSDEGGLTDRRRWTSFLTWAFVLAEMAGRDGFLPMAAHAGDEDLGRSPHADDQAAPTLNNLPDVGVSTPSEGAEPTTYQQAASGAPLPAPTPISGELADAKMASADDGNADTAAGGGGGGYGDLAHQAQSLSAADASAGIAGAHIGEGASQLVGFNHAGDILDLGPNLDLSQTVHGLVDGVLNGLGDLPLVGGLLEDVSHTLAGTSSNLLSTPQPVIFLLGISGDHDSHPSNFGLGMPGYLDFGSKTAPTDEMATPHGGYTSYGIALNAEVGDAAHGSADSGSFDAGILDHFADDHLPGDHLNTSSDALQLDQVLLRTASDVLA